MLEACGSELGITPTLALARVEHLLRHRPNDPGLQASSAPPATPSAAVPAWAAAAVAAGRRGSGWEAAAATMIAAQRSLEPALPQETETETATAYPSVDVALDSFRTLYCRRCHVFDCKQHGCGQVLPPQRRTAAAAAAAADGLSQPCGSACRHLGAAAAGALGQADSQQPWTSLEQTFFTVAHGMFGRDSCRTARLLGTRSCAEVAAFTAAADREGAGEAAAGTKGSAGGGLRGAGGRHRRRAGATNIKSTRKRATATVRRRMTQEDPMWAQYSPCGCAEAQGCGAACSCVADGNFCERFCGCPASCGNAFPGCNCIKGQCRTRACPCFAASRECDPDLCRRCCLTAARVWRARAGLVAPDPAPGEAAAPAAAAAALGGGAEAGEDCCDNMKLLLQQHKHLLLGQSDVAGWGAFLGEPVRKNEYLGEYTGELISQAEADRRGKIYDRVNCSFLFNLNNEWVLDAQVKARRSSLVAAPSFSLPRSNQQTAVEALVSFNLKCARRISAASSLSA